jgi:hypothetical protein
MNLAKVATFKRSFDLKKCFLKIAALCAATSCTGNKSCLKKIINKGIFLQLAVYFISNFVI